MTTSQYIVTPRALNGRTGPGISFSKQTTFLKGQLITPVDTRQTSNGHWTAVRMGKGVLWVSSSYIAEYNPNAAFRFEAWPTPHETRPSNGRTPINQVFGANPQNYQQFNLAGHEGVDLYLKEGDPVTAVAPGRVFRIHTDPKSHNYGLHVRIRHANGYRTIYCHLSEIHVKTGDPIKAGQVIGLGGSTGRSSGPHLHLTLKRDNAHTPGYPYNIINPMPYVYDWLRG